jgi:nucleoside diphosphate kinase
LGVEVPMWVLEDCISNMYDEHHNQPKFVKVLERLEKGNLFSCLMMCRSIESTWRSMTGGSEPR